MTIKLKMFKENRDLNEFFIANNLFKSTFQLAEKILDRRGAYDLPGLDHRLNTLLHFGLGCCQGVKGGRGQIGNHCRFA